jgi:hypothetical protein
MAIASLIWLLAGLVVATVAHEATHWLLAHRRGLRLTSVRLSPIGVMLTFPAVAATHYLALQVVTPILVTWIVFFGWLQSLTFWPARGADYLASMLASPVSVLLMITLVAVVMSAGDLHELVLHLADRGHWSQASSDEPVSSPAV